MSLLHSPCCDICVSAARGGDAAATVGGGPLLSMRSTNSSFAMNPL